MNIYLLTQHKILNINISYIFLFTKRITQTCGINPAKNAVYPKQVDYTKHQAGQRMQEYLYFPIIEKGGIR